MSSVLRLRLPYRQDARCYYACLRDLPWPVWLDSGTDRERRGRYDIISADPFITLTAEGSAAVTRSCVDGRTSRAAPWAALRDALGPVEAISDDLPFAGGAIGFAGYDLGREAAGLPPRTAASDFPDMAVGIYGWAVIVDHRRRRCELVRSARDPRGDNVWQAARRRLDAMPHALPQMAPPGGELTGNGIGRGAYAEAFDRIQRYIRDGDCYQVNFAQRFTALSRGDAWCNYQVQRSVNPAPYAALLEYPFGAVLSASPEQFLRVRAGRVRTRPIKGTRPRGHNAAHDSALRSELRDSAKDRAENLMIVDLLRNDLGKVCRPGSIRVPELFRVESFATVHHLVSTVTGELASGCDAVDLLQACFPGGSITGAPKRRAMQIIDELETEPRQVYCGSVMRLGFDGSLDSSITIRTVLQRGDELRYWAGGGIVADSECAAEYQESLDKAAAFLRLFD